VDATNSSERGFEFRIYVCVDCAAKEFSLLWTNNDDGDDVRPSGALSEECCDASEVASGSLDLFRFFPKG
jgi:hypothetical protein